MFIFNLKGGTYCLDIEEQAKILLQLLKADLPIYCKLLFISIFKLFKLLLF